MQIVGVRNIRLMKQLKFLIMATNGLIGTPITKDFIN
jgi:hypothetical protein